MSSAAETSPRKLPALVWALGLISLLADVSSELVHPLLPLFVVGTLGASATTLGLIEGSAEALVSLAKAWAGLRSDRSGRRMPFLRWGYALPMAGKLVIAAAAAWPSVLAGRLLDRLGKGLRTAPRDALLAESVPRSKRGAAFGLHRAMDHAGALIGALLAMLLVALGWPLTRIFLVAAGVGLAAWVLTLRLREPGAETAHPRDGARDFPPAYWRALALLLLPAAGQCGVAFVLLRMHDLGWQAWQVVAAYAGIYAVAGATSVPLGRLADSRGRHGLLALGWLLFSAADLGLAQPGFAGVLLPLILYGAALGASEGAAKAWLADLSPRGRRGAGLGLSAGLLGGAQIAGGLLAGLLWDQIQPEATFYSAAAASALAAVLLAVASWKQRF